ncbi:hypothetical protein EJB05_28408, partial [Eragrostis curvula]
MPSLKAVIMEDGGDGDDKNRTTTTTTLVSLLRARSERSAEAEAKVEWVRSQLVGRGAEFETPFGRRALVYADHTATGRSLRYIEDYILKNVLPFYGNTHTEDSYVGSRTTRTTKKAARYIKRCVGAGPDDALIFCGSGATAAAKRLQEAMGVACSLPPPLRARLLAAGTLPAGGPSLADVVELPAAANGGGGVDLDALRRALGSPEYASRPMLGSFSRAATSPASVTDTRAVARVLHQHGAFACFDFAARTVEQ